MSLTFWTTEEDNRLRMLLEAGKPIEFVAAELKRSEKAVTARAQHAPNIAQTCKSEAEGEGGKPYDQPHVVPAILEGGAEARLQPDDMAWPIYSGAVGAGRGPLNESRVTLLLTWTPAPMPSAPRDQSSKSCRLSLEGAPVWHPQFRDSTSL